MKKIIDSQPWIAFLDSVTFRVLMLLLGLALVVFYGILLLAALVNLPASWFGLLYSSGGMISGTLCFVYFFRKNKLLLVAISPFAILMMITVGRSG